jgi:hypothetical protein
VAQQASFILATRSDGRLLIESKPSKIDLAGTSRPSLIDFASYFSCFLSCSSLVITLIISVGSRARL